jgi:hypothetical protein
MPRPYNLPVLAPYSNIYELQDRSNFRAKAAGVIGYYYPIFRHIEPEADLDTTTFHTMNNDALNDIYRFNDIAAATLVSDMKTVHLPSGNRYSAFEFQNDRTNPKYYHHKICSDEMWRIVFSKVPGARLFEQIVNDKIDVINTLQSFFRVHEQDFTDAELSGYIDGILNKITDPILIHDLLQCVCEHVPKQKWISTVKNFARGQRYRDLAGPLKIAFKVFILNNSRPTCSRCLNVDPERCPNGEAFDMVSHECIQQNQCWQAPNDVCHDIKTLQDMYRRNPNWQLPDNSGPLPARTIQQANRAQELWESIL